MKSLLNISYFAIAHFLGIISLSFAGSCREAQLCCNGRDSSCVVQKAPINAIIEDLSDKPCYCDHACLKLGDCCPDFKDYCGVIDCQVSEWGPWSECDTTCGTGMMSRSRTIEKMPENGGKHCPSLVQKRGCQAYRCYGHKDRKILREMALLLPASFSRNRHANDSNDIRKNLRLRYWDSFKHNREHEYCIEFEVIKASKACHKLPPYNLMLEGDRITVRCDLEALIHDSNNNNTSADSISSNDKTDVINSDQNEITNNSSLMDDDDINKIHITSTSESQFSQFSQENQQQQQHHITLQKYRCRGEGLPGRTTRWSALAAPSCRGKWLRLTIGQPKKCIHSQFIFV